MALEKYPIAGFIALRLSGLIDAADGTLARLTKPSALGSILDITFDRVVEVAMILALAYNNPDARFPLLLLAGIIAIAMSLFPVDQSGGRQPVDQVVSLRARYCPPIQAEVTYTSTSSCRQLNVVRASSVYR